MSITRIKPSMYKHALKAFEEQNPTRAKMLTPDIEGGVCYFFTAYRGYVNLIELNPGLFEVRGAFKLEGGAPGFAEAIVTWCRLLGGTVIQLDCYSTVCGVWLKAGFDTYRIEPFDITQAPKDWPEVYGHPDVYYMCHYIGGKHGR